MKLACNLWSFSTGKRRERLNQSTGTERAKLIGRFALANNFWWVYEPKPHDASGYALLQQAERTFGIGYEVWSTTSASVRKLGLITALASGTAFSLRVTGALMIVSTYKFSFDAASGALTEAFTILTLGLFVSTLFYLTHFFFEATLRRRKVVWDRILREARESVDAETSFANS